MNNTLKQHILFDLDDTLIHCNKYFGLVLGEFFELVHHWLGHETLSTDEIRQKQIEIDVAQVSKTGFNSINFPNSLIETYRYFCRELNRPIHLEEEQQLNKLGLSVYEQEVEPYPGMVETLETLQKEGHYLYLYTGGETAIQQRKIDQMKLSTYFDNRIYITQHKNESTLEQILQRGSFDRSSTWMIGNSLRTDVVPALTAGLQSIYIKQSDEWVYNMVELQQEPGSSFYTISSIEEIPDIIDIKIKQEIKQRPLN
ncbi:HAD hydrolase-like protein [Paenibacillus dokdonensis]|uniref:HAD hydrolase-like protein n=1 Tax=Paenibacillus dokdonensis TaxID=2567944 RepID=A0ABU6GIL1_9BACL|nr:HAD hydrolase-like protein [Paenibacillus dokdonensis]MEC0239571.1 HAD hydrolase-like protein [Paenibacillus dokdonensis]